MSAIAKQFSGLPDAYWSAAAEVTMAALGEAEHVLVPAEFLALDPRFAPLEYSWGLKGTGRKLAFCCAKDEVDRLAPWLATSRAGHYAWSNEVFVLGANFRWRRKGDTESRRHLISWFERLQEYQRGIPSRESKERRLSGGASTSFGAPVRQAASSRKVLLVGASGMGNVGDDLLADVLADLLSKGDLDVYASGPDIDPLRVAAYDAVVVGGGGLIYASRDGSNETQNLANYLKFGPIGRQFRVPTGLIGIGDQDHDHGLERDNLTSEFARYALTRFQTVTTRDTETAQLLEAYGAKNPRASADLLFYWTHRARSAVKPRAAPKGRIALAGELYRFRVFAEGLGTGDGPLSADIRDGDYDLLIMSNDDVEHADRAQAALRNANASAAIVDLRGRDLESLVFLFGSYSGLVTTRFHGLVLAAMIGVPVLALDVPNGKCARLLTKLGAPQSLLLEDTGAEGVTKLGQALNGNRNSSRIPPHRVTELAKQTKIHRYQLHTLTKIKAESLPSNEEPRAVQPPQAWAARSADSDVCVPSVLFQDAETIPLCWAASTKQTAGFANLGDSLSAVIVTALSGRPVQHVAFTTKTTKLVAVGSIGHAIRRGIAVVWGTGVSIRGGLLARNVPETHYDVRAVRGKISAQHYRDFGIKVPNVFGDPVWLLPSILDEPVEKKYELGVIPHIQDVETHHPTAPPKADSLRYLVDGADAADVAVINTWHEPTWEGLLSKIRLIRSCKRIVSQSFHGVVIAEAYGIPVLNFRYQVGAENGPLRINLHGDCNTDPRVWEFFEAGRRAHLYMYTQRRDQRTDWSAVVAAIDELWEPFEYDAAPLLEAFPLPLAYDPLSERIDGYESLRALRF